MKSCQSPVEVGRVTPVRTLGSSKPFPNTQRSDGVSALRALDVLADYFKLVPMLRRPGKRFAQRGRDVRLLAACALEPGLDLAEVEDRRVAQDESDVACDAREAVTEGDQKYLNGPKLDSSETGHSSQDDIDSMFSCV